MPWAIEIAFSNTLVAAAAALVVTFLARYLDRRPAIIYVMWLVVLLKLVTPPMFSIPVAVEWTNEPLASVDSNDAPNLIVGDLDNINSIALLSAELKHLRDASFLDDTSTASLWRLVIAVWLIGSIVLAALSVYRILRFSSLLPASQSCEKRVTAIANRTARQLGLNNTPPIVVVDSRVPPLVWYTGRHAKIVLPKKLVGIASEEQLVLLLAHEMAHIQRGDHLVRWLTLIVLALNWWNPVAWWAVHRLRDAEEQCCDAMVVANSACTGHAYAETLLETLDFLAAGATLPPQLASGINSGSTMKKRFEMIINGQSSFRVGKLAGTLLLLLSVAVLAPSIVRADDDESSNREQRIEQLQKLVEKLSLELELVKKEHSNRQDAVVEVDPFRALDLRRKGKAVTITLTGNEELKSQDVEKLVNEITTREGNQIGEISIVVSDKKKLGEVGSLTLYGDSLDKANLRGVNVAVDAKRIKADVKSKHGKEARLKEGKEKMGQQEKAMRKLQQELEAKHKETLELQRKMEMMQLQMMELQAQMEKASH